MTVGGVPSLDNSVTRLSGWELVAALAVLAVLILGTLWMTKSVIAAVLITIPLLIALSGGAKQLLRIWKG
jgi:hypothetical protein